MEFDNDYDAPDDLLEVEPEPYEDDRETFEQRQLDLDNEGDEGDFYEPEDHDEDDTRNEMFADPGGHSALRASSASNPRNLPCPNCGASNRLTPADRARGYQCDACADRAERGGDY